MASLIEDSSLRDRVRVFADRTDAGKRLASLLAGYGVPSRDSGGDSGGIVFAIPAGGVPVAAEIASALRLSLELLITRKLQIPYNPEAGFGAVTPDGEVVFNEDLMRYLKLSGDDIRKAVERTMENIRQREQLFRQGRPYPEVRGKTVLVVDDGLASGFTMRAAVRFLRKSSPGRVVVAVPTGLESTLRRIMQDAAEVVCLNVRTGVPFAVAAAYRKWHDLTDADVLNLIHKFGT
ncbi:MAG: phosphoribosyltransferase [Alphaproteobacteria bacterium]|uniref:Phosphoribosyltransferase n=1 Tax=Candidatus Nitrobium versatile TaxID=2884831 RepID=A0A953M1M4_9BACT|nr:phosphoribosyltransferase [Candidatus Nitrobium versatile]